MKIKKSVFQGSFYPEDKDELRDLIVHYIDNAEDKSHYKNVRAIIVPHAGYVYSGQVVGFGYKTLIKEKIKRIVIVGPSHNNYFNGIALADYDFWQTPLGKVKLFQPKKEHEKEFVYDVNHFQKEHSVEVQIPFLQVLDENIQIMVMVTGRVDDYAKYAGIISEYLDDRTVLIVSSDLSHYLSYEDAGATDLETLEKILLFDSSVGPDQACGSEAINILLEIAKLKHWQPMLLDYRNSGDTAGDRMHVVGYAAIAFTL